MAKFCNFNGFVADCTLAKKKPSKVLDLEFSSECFYGCSSHGQHPFVKKILASLKAKAHGATHTRYRTCYFVKELLSFAADYKDGITFSHNYHVVKAQLDSALKAMDQSIVKLPHELAGDHCSNA